VTPSTMPVAARDLISSMLPVSTKNFILKSFVICSITIRCSTFFKRKKI
jgi:hypothetical protein